ncbi:hypothetical protein Pint_05584 [Pistacia integerrima]|uniref:Uncharacterized protein n=1 Tax=Pistacia integerrima TaxID=434235 RepID=A0ACC0Z2F7_9ROSI|nr:hypothetical protein Pint_05584 [Pistacia integerrima]
MKLCMGSLFLHFYLMCQVQEQMKKFYDVGRTDKSLNVGDFLYLKLQPYRQVSVALRKNLKLSPKYYGPFEIIERVGPVAYKLRLPNGSQLHPVFHVSVLKEKLGTNANATWEDYHALKMRFPKLTLEDMGVL